jgi:hypothetical protein
MVDGRKKRQTERELCRLMWAWIVLKRRHERRQERRNLTATLPQKEASMKKDVSKPPRQTNKPGMPRSPTNPMDETRITSRSMKSRTKFQEELWQQCLRQRKRILEREFRSSKIKAHNFQ